ncbi:hypothetical protein ASTA108788_13145 [Asticcacaulis taihuensis]|uniref:Uncharacterized protein n=1 Tax=Asticcacaulis taihuensis TaxID=260084 RepID=A0A1G4RE02_9CAUL|nr:hypothetical protein SAMN02927928_1816 [Asticcacaulis taihuensis]
MMLLSLGPDALVALLRTHDRRTAPNNRRLCAETVTELPLNTNPSAAFPSFLQSSN